MGILVLALVWRVVIALTLPVISRDGVTFCWYARALQQFGFAHLRGEDTHQHPLFPGLILGVKSILTAAGAAETPLLWQRCGQAICISAGLLVVFLTGRIAARLAAALGWASPPQAALAAALLAALLPLNVGLSADVMSDQVHLAFYLGALLGCLSGNSFAAAGVGLLSGLAFLTRPEGAALVLAGGAAVLASGWGRWREIGVRLSALGLAFLMLAGPFWMITGELSPKKNPLELVRSGAFWDGGDSAAPPRTVSACAGGCSPGRGSARPDLSDTSDSTAARRGVYARLRLVDVAPHELPLWVTERMLHAGRYVVPLAAVATLLRRRRELWRALLAGPATAFGLHSGLLLLLLHRYDYLDARHALPLVAVLIPFAAFWLLSVRRPSRGAAWLVMLAPLMFYALRVPNGDQSHLREAAEWLRAADPERRGRVLTGGNSQIRIAFYADMGWRYWLEDPGQFERIRREFLANRPDYLALETGAEDHFERRGHAALLAALKTDPEIGPRLNLLRTIELEDAGVRATAAPEATRAALHLYQLDWR